MGGSISGTIAALTDVLAPLRPAVVVPGHGPVGDATLVDRVVGHLRWVQGLARAGRQVGLWPLDLALESDLSRVLDLVGPGTVVGNLHRAYAELGGTSPGTRIDVRAAMTGMVTDNGGHRPTCRA